MRILDEALVCHLSFVDRGQPYAIPTLHARVGQWVYVHGSAAGRADGLAGSGAPICLTATLLDGLVLARSAFHHSVNYRSVVVLGRAERIDGSCEKLAALELFVEKIIPGRWAQCRPPSASELRATTILRVSLSEASAKIRAGPPSDEPSDRERSTWAGVVPLRLAALHPEPDGDQLPRFPEGLAAALMQRGLLHGAGGPAEPTA